MSVSWTNEVATRIGAVDAGASQQEGRLAFLFLQKSQQQVRRLDVVGSEELRPLLGVLQGAADGRGEFDLHSWSSGSGFAWPENPTYSGQPRASRVSLPGRLEQMQRLQRARGSWFVISPRLCFQIG